MAKYVCEELHNFTCLKWVEYQTSLDMLAITEQQADVILYASLSVVFGAWTVRQVLNVILQRRY